MIDIVIPTCNRGALIAGTLESLQASRHTDLHVWVVDQSDGQGTADVARRFAAQDSRFSYISTPTRGSNIARNIGIRAASAPIVAFTDDDCRVDPDWVGTLLAEYERDPQAWSVFGRVIPGQDGGPDAATPALSHSLPLAFKDDPQRLVFQDNRLNLGFGHGANMSFRRAAFERVGLFDELLGVGAPLRSWPERDMGYRILAAGGRIVYSPDALVIHHHWRDWPGVKKTYRNYAIGAGATVGKYLRCGDRNAIWLLLEWFWSQGIRQIASGVIKWHSWHKVVVGIMQLTYPFVGLWQGRHYPISTEHWVYLPRDTDA